MKTLIEEDSAVTPLAILAVVFLVLLGSGPGLAYLGGAFADKKAVIATEKKIASQAAMIVHPR